MRDRISTPRTSTNRDAYASAVVSSPSLRNGFMWLFRQAATSYIFPLCTAHIKGVTPAFVCASISTSSICIRMLKWSRLPRLHAKWSGVLPMLSFALGLALSSSTVYIISTLPTLDARWSAFILCVWITVSIGRPFLTNVYIGRFLFWSIALVITWPAFFISSWFGSSVDSTMFLDLI